MGRNTNTFSKDFKAAKANKTLSKPRDIDYTSKMGYQDGSPFSNRAYMDINTPSGYIDMSNTGRPIMANGQYLPPYSGMHYMGTPVVREVPINLNLPNIDFTPKGEFNLYGNKHYLGANYYQPLPGGGFSLGMGSPTKFFNPNFSVGFNKKFQDGGWLNELPKAQVGLSHRDSIAHQADKILKYEVLRGGPGGTPLKEYKDPKYKKILMDQILPEVDKIMPHASAMEKAEAMDFIFNSGWNHSTNKISKDPRAYALQEYYRKYDKSKLDANGDWSGRKNAPYSFDQEYANTIGKLSENDRRILMNKGRDWYYKNTAPKGSSWDLKTQGPHPNYDATWYGRIWNTNDFSDFNPNNPNFKPKKQYGGLLEEVPMSEYYPFGGQYSKTHTHMQIGGSKEIRTLQNNLKNAQAPKLVLPNKLNTNSKFIYDSAPNIEGGPTGYSWGRFKINKGEVYPLGFLGQIDDLIDIGQKFIKHDSVDQLPINPLIQQPDKTRVKLNEPMEYKKGGVNPLMKARSKRDTTNKNIQSSINKLFLRNPDLFGPGGKNIYDPETNKKLNTMSNKKKYGGDSGAPYNGQPTANEFFGRGWIPPGPVGFYKLGGQSTNEIAFPQQVPSNYFFAGVPWQNDLGHFAYGGGLPGGANQGMPCMECGGYMQDGGFQENYLKSRAQDSAWYNPRYDVLDMFGGTFDDYDAIDVAKRYGAYTGVDDFIKDQQELYSNPIRLGAIEGDEAAYRAYQQGKHRPLALTNADVMKLGKMYAEHGDSWETDSPMYGNKKYNFKKNLSPSDYKRVKSMGEWYRQNKQYGGDMAMGGVPQQYGGVNDGTMGTFKEGGNWIQKATASIKKRGTEGVCTGDKFGGPGCPPGSKRYNLAKTFRAMAKKAYGGTTDGVDQDDYISSRANAFNNAVRMNYGMAEADNQMKRLDQEQQALAQQAAMYAMPQAQYGINYNPQMGQAIGNYNQAQGMLDQWNQQGKDSWNQFFGSLGQGANNAYNRNAYVKWDLKPSKTPDFGKAIRAVQDVNTDYNAGYKAKEGGALQKYVDAGAVPKMAVGRLEGEDDYNKAKADFYRSQGFDDVFDNMYFNPQQDMYRNSAYANLPWMQPRDYYMRYGMTPQYHRWRDSYSGGDGDMLCTEHGCIPQNHDPRIHQYPGYYQETPFYRTSANGQTYYDYGYPNMWRNVNQYPGGAGGSWNTPGWGGPNPFYNQMFGNPNMYTTLGDVDVKRGLFGSMKNPKRVKMHFNTYFNPTTGRVESAPAADQLGTASTTSTTPAATTPATTTTTDNKSKLSPMQQKALDDVNKVITRTNLYNDVQEGFNNPSELTEDQIADLRGPVTPSPINPDLERELNPLDPMMSMQARRINPNMPTPASRSVSVPTLDQAAEWMSNARNYYGNQMAQNSGVYNMPGISLPSVTQSQDASNAYRQNLLNAQQAAYNAAQNKAGSNYIGQNTGVFNIPNLTTLPSVLDSQKASQEIRDAKMATPSFPYAIPTSNPIRTERQQQMDAFQQNRFTPNAVNNYAPASKPLPSVRSLPQGQYPSNVLTPRQKWLYDTYGDRFFGINPGMAYGGYLPMAQNGVNNTDPNAIPAMSPMKPRTIGLPPQQPQAPPALQASPMTPVGGWELTKEKKTPWSGQDLYGIFSGAIGMGTNLALGDEKRKMQEYVNRQTMADNLFSAANPYRGDITQTGAGYGSQFGSLNQTPTGAYTKSGGYVYANGGAYETGVPMELTDEEIQAIMAAGGTVRYI